MKQKSSIKIYIEGAVIVEFALIAPILILILFAIIEFSWILQHKQTVSIACREGARMLAKQGSSINQAEKLVTTNLNNNGISTKNAILSGYDSNPTCSRKNGTISMQIKVPIETLALSGDIFNLYKNRYIEAKVTMNKECMG